MQTPTLTNDEIRYLLDLLRYAGRRDEVHHAASKAGVSLQRIYNTLSQQYRVNSGHPDAWWTALERAGLATGYGDRTIREDQLAGARWRYSVSGDDEGHGIELSANGVTLGWLGRGDEYGSDGDATRQAEILIDGLVAGEDWAVSLLADQAAP